MKYNLLIIPVLLFLVIPKITFGQNQIDNSKKTIYYFCTSRAWNLDMVKEGKQEIKYTEIKSAELPEKEIMGMAKKWGNYANLNCKYDQCTSDLNEYPTLEMAKEYLERFLHSNLDKNEYKLIEINLE